MFVKKGKVQLLDGDVLDDLCTVKIQDTALVVTVTEGNQMIHKSENRNACDGRVIE